MQPMKDESAIALPHSRSRAIMPLLLLARSLFCMIEAMESNLIQELLSRHQNKPQPESVALTSVLTAIRDVVEDQGLSVSPVSSFAAAVASLSATESQADVQVLT